MLRLLLSMYKCLAFMMSSGKEVHGSVMPFIKKSLLLCFQLRSCWCSLMPPRSPRDHLFTIHSVFSTLFVISETSFIYPFYLSAFCTEHELTWSFLVLQPFHTFSYLFSFSQNFCVLVHHFWCLLESRESWLHTVQRIPRSLYWHSKVLCIFPDEEHNWCTFLTAAEITLSWNSHKLSNLWGNFICN